MARLSERKVKPLCEVTIVTSGEAEDAVAELLQRIFKETASIYANRDKEVSAVTVYVDRPLKQLRALEPKLRAGFEEIEMYGLDTAPAQIIIEKVKREDWAESWKKYFKTIRMGRKLIVKPSWSKEKGAKGQAVVELDPGLSFGTGQHPTTWYCLKQIAERVRPGASLLDIGCGSGILAISAAKLGYAPVEAFDFDPVAVRIAQANMRRNRVDQKIKCARRDLTKLPLKATRTFDIISANLISDLLVDESDRILNRLAKNGHLIVAGILATQFPEVQEAYESKGLRLLDTKTEREWQSGLFAR
ncbi:MAG TPA: 50S ribosomal protein L11 methyltransferase [Verrucomicrobiae bacterium]|nr:50S ribosomal protein L11 methyltransferase [Verrucomicrobiae bacterium]